LVDGVRKPMFDYERMLCKALLEPLAILTILLIINQMILQA
jgi:hypothetical protein